jgi:hypothetical protein
MFYVGQMVRCKSITSMASQLAKTQKKLQIGDGFTVMHVKPGKYCTVLVLEKDGKPFCGREAFFPCNDFELIPNAT